MRLLITESLGANNQNITPTVPSTHQPSAPVGETNERKPTINMKSNKSQNAKSSKPAAQAKSVKPVEALRQTSLPLPEGSSAAPVQVEPTPTESSAMNQADQAPKKSKRAKRPDAEPADHGHAQPSAATTQTSLDLEQPPVAPSVVANEAASPETSFPPAAQANAASEKDKADFAEYDAAVKEAVATGNLFQERLIRGGRGLREIAARELYRIGGFETLKQYLGSRGLLSQTVGKWRRAADEFDALLAMNLTPPVPMEHLKITASVVPEMKAAVLAEAAVQAGDQKITTAHFKRAVAAVEADKGISIRTKATSKESKPVDPVQAAYGGITKSIDRELDNLTAAQRQCVRKKIARDMHAVLAGPQDPTPLYMQDEMQEVA